MYFIFYHSRAMIQSSRGKGTKSKKRKKETTMKKISVLLEKLYVSFVHGRG